MVTDYTPDGQVGFYQYGIVWANWTFRVGGPPYKQDAVVRGVRDYTAFWAAKNGVDLANARFRVKVKHITPPVNWEPDFLEHQMEVPWEDAGMVEWKNKEFTSYLQPITSL